MCLDRNKLKIHHIGMANFEKNLAQMCPTKNGCKNFVLPKTVEHIVL